MQQSNTIFVLASADISLQNLSDLTIHALLSADPFLEDGGLFIICFQKDLSKDEPKIVDIHREQEGTSLQMFIFFKDLSDPVSR